jgi:hypothetical protein
VRLEPFRVKVWARVRIGYLEEFRKRGGEDTNLAAHVEAFRDLRESFMNVNCKTLKSCKVVDSETT